MSQELARYQRCFVLPESFLCSGNNLNKVY